MRKVLLIGLAAGLSLALENAMRGEQRVVQAYEIKRRREVPTEPLEPPQLLGPSFRKSKGEKKRAASQRRKKGWA